MSSIQRPFACTKTKLWFSKSECTISVISITLQLFSLKLTYCILMVAPVSKLLINLNKLYPMKEERRYEIESDGSNVVVNLRNS